MDCYGTRDLTDNMRFSVALPFVAYLSFSGSAAAFHCPEEDIINTQCLGPKDCLYPNPDNCGTFIQCTVNPDGITGTPVVMPCPAGLK
ncbi:Race-specific elicitor A4 [Penicillium subrubescens]|uniref:Race-specific elicitor A4 n=1 Tax=Penicillium subrubescens TaxID=1316194 RepID=A0A1Q5SXK1_9EURO|nr:Race-specific elicitor A4 [Penicillium subrubescens]